MAIAVGGLLFGVVLAVVVFVFAVPSLEESGDIENNLGDDVFSDIRADEELARDIAERGPLLISDVAGGDRDVFVQHVGDDPEKGWLVFAARPADAGRDCTLAWDGEQEQFDDPCSDRTFPADGEGLKQYPVERDEDDFLVVDLNFEDRPEETTTSLRITGGPGD
jgi:hypothetical protein